MNNLIYLDNAATSFPKPECVYLAVNKALRESCGNPGRSGHKLSLAANQTIHEARLLCARLLHAKKPEQIIFTNNATTALNIAIKGLLQPGDHVITSSLEHNSVARPLKHMEAQGVEVSKIPTDFIHGLNGNVIKPYQKTNTKLVVCTHISNVTGTINDIASIGAFCRKQGILFLVDAAQSIGTKPIDVESMCIDMLAFPGHKGLLGPQGTGGLYLKPGLPLNTIIEGGTGSTSESLIQPENLPERFESGTANTPGLAGLAAGIRFILDTGIDTISAHETNLTQQLIEGILKIEQIQLIEPNIIPGRGSVVSICFSHISVAEAALIMDSAFQIAVRSGLHCAPDAHQTAGTLKTGGTLRISPNYFNTTEDINQCLEALQLIAKGR
ncbi:MAG: aminotransferase class V-fold PLP-dependent enzyme [Lachnospiraceae bacterium]|nr:aminotransferase class V-fold PLP-dependent enzyme [Lachnospiraceae bacterium]